MGLRRLDVATHRSGPDVTVERPAIGRRSSECQVDCANLLIPGPLTLLDVAPDAADGDAMPRLDEPLISVRDFLRDDVMPGTEGRTSFMARVASNSLGAPTSTLRACPDDEFITLDDARAALPNSSDGEPITGSSGRVRRPDGGRGAVRSRERAAGTHVSIGSVSQFS